MHATIILPVDGCSGFSSNLTCNCVALPGSSVSGILDASENHGLSNVAMNAAFSASGFLNSIVTGLPPSTLNGPCG